jgi:hypothetical protein
MTSLKSACKKPLVQAPVSCFVPAGGGVGEGGGQILLVLTPWCWLSTKSEMSQLEAVMRPAVRMRKEGV